MNKNRILLVDDDLGTTTTFKTALEENGYIVDAYNDPFLALSSFRGGVYDIILIDIRMPGMNGFELCQKIFNIDNHARICFITAFRTYWGSLEELIIPKSKQPLFIKKPVEIDDLVRTIKLELET